LDAAWANLTTTGPGHHRVGAYLASRGIDLGILEGHTRRSEAGHTPTGTPLDDALTAEGFTPDELVDAGPARRRPGRHLVDYYQQRVLIPVRDPDGHLAGLIGRNVGNARWPKYTNPPRTASYDKSINLYQPLPAPARPVGAVVVVEGTLDAMAIAVAAVPTGQADRYCPLTQSGRELSPSQLDRVLRLYPTPPVIAFDADPGGRDSTTRVAAAANRRGAAVLIANLGDGHDPASWLATQGGAGLNAWNPGRFRRSVRCAARPGPAPTASPFPAGPTAPPPTCDEPKSSHEHQPSRVTGFRAKMSEPSATPLANRPGRLPVYLDVGHDAVYPRPARSGIRRHCPGQESNHCLASAVARLDREALVTSFLANADPASWLAERGPGGLIARTRPNGTAKNTHDAYPPPLARVNAVSRPSGPRLAAPATVQTTGGQRRWCPTWEASTP